MEHVNKVNYFSESEISVLAQLLWEEDATLLTLTRLGTLSQIQLCVFGALTCVGFQASERETPQLDFCSTLLPFLLVVSVFPPEFQMKLNPLKL